MKTMNRIILAYCHDNADLADVVEQRLGRIGIPFERITHRPDDGPGDFINRLQGAEDPAILFITDNFFKSQACMSGALAGIQALLNDKRLLIVVADGKVSHDGGASFEPVETHFDRMVYALQYMNFWQTAWLALSDRYQHAEGDAKAALEQELNATHNIANETGELISVLRESGYVTWEQFANDDFALFFRQYGLDDWHVQYRQLANTSYVPLDATPPIPENAPHKALAEMPVVAGGALIPEPAEIEEKGQPAPPSGAWAEPDLNFSAEQLSAEKTTALNGHFNGMNTLIEEMEREEGAAGQTNDGFTSAEPDFEEEAFELPEAEIIDPRETEAQIEQAIRDAWFWMDKGHIERGLDLLQFSVEQHPDNERIKQELEIAQAKFHPQEAMPEPEAAVEVSPEFNPPLAVDGFSPQEQSPAEGNEARSYDLMGDMAAEKGDYLFAKYCWDRAAEIDATYPDIFRKLGLMTSEHLRDYRETAVHYLGKAIEQNPNDADVHFALAGSILQNDDPAQAEAHYTQAVLLNPALRTAENDRMFRRSDRVEKEAPVEKVPTFPSAEAIPQPQPVLEKREVLTVLVTGATSGIGRATAEIFIRNGHRVILTGRRVERLVLLKTEFEEELHADVLMLPFDVREPGAVQAALDNLPESWQNIDVLVNNAGLAKGLAPIQEGNLDHWEQMIDTNIKGVLYVTRAVAPGMVARRRGHIVNIGSSAGKEVYVNGNVYCATKFAVEALTRAMRLDLHTHNIRVGQVSPGHVEETEFAITRFDGDAERARIYNDFQPLKSSDVAEAIYWMVTRPPHVNVQDIQLFATQQASATVVDRSGRG